MQIRAALIALDVFETVAQPSLHFARLCVPGALVVTHKTLSPSETPVYPGAMHSALVVLPAHDNSSHHPASHLFPSIHCGERLRATPVLTVVIVALAFMTNDNPIFLDVVQKCFGSVRVPM